MITFEQARRLLSKHISDKTRINHLEEAKSSDTAVSSEETKTEDAASTEKLSQKELLKRNLQSR